MWAGVAAPVGGGAGPEQAAAWTEVDGVLIHASVPAAARAELPVLLAGIAQRWPGAQVLRVERDPLRPDAPWRHSRVGVTVRHANGTTQWRAIGQVRSAVAAAV